MAQELFYVAHAGQQEGPFSVEEVTKRVKEHKLEGTDYVYDEALADWVMLMAHASFARIIKENKPVVVPLTPPPQPLPQSQKDAAAEDGLALLGQEEWFVLKGDLRFGPFARTEIVRLLQEKSLLLTEYIWTPAMASWERVSDIKTFSPEEIRRLKESGLPGINEAFFARRHRRIAYGASLLVHDNRRLYKGKGVEISEGGAAFSLENASFEPGQKVFLHFKPDAELPSFNAYCEVVSRRNAKSADKSIQYGIKFLKIDHATSEQIQKLARERTAA